MKRYTVEITDEALADENRVIVTDVLYTASDIENRLKGV